MNFRHQNLAGGRWQKLSLAEQLGNIGSEVSRAARSQKTNGYDFENAVERALELFDLTIEDPRWKNRLREIERTKEVFCDALNGGKEYGSSIKDLVRYFDEFAYAARVSL